MSAALGKHLIVNERAPVTAWPRTNFRLGRVVATETRKFKNLAEFKLWYREAQHGEVWPNSQFLFTDILVDSIADRDMRVAAKSAAGPTRSRVEVDGVPHGSVFKAFEALGLPIKDHGPFRARLKRAGQLEYAGKKFRVLA